MYGITCVCCAWQGESATPDIKQRVTSPPLRESERDRDRDRERETERGVRQALTNKGRFCDHLNTHMLCHHVYQHQACDVREKQTSYMLCACMCGGSYVQVCRQEQQAQHMMHRHGMSCARGCMLKLATTQQDGCMCDG